MDGIVKVLQARKRACRRNNWLRRLHGMFASARPRPWGSLPGDAPDPALGAALAGGFRPRSLVCLTGGPLLASSPCCGLDRRGMWTTLLPQTGDPLHDPLHRLLRPDIRLAQMLQDQAQIHLHHRLGRRRGDRRFLPLLQQVEGHKGPAPLLEPGAGQQLLGKRLGEYAKGRQARPVLGARPHIRFGYGDGIHQNTPLCISSMRVTARPGWLLFIWGPVTFRRWAPTTLQIR